jgi:hypothetical protein
VLQIRRRNQLSATGSTARSLSWCCDTCMTSAEVGGWGLGGGLELHLNVVIPTFTWETWLHTLLLWWGADTRDFRPLLFILGPDTWVTDWTTGESGLNFRPPGRDIDHPSAYSTEVKIAWRLTSTPPYLQCLAF